MEEAGAGGFEGGHEEGRTDFNIMCFGGKVGLDDHEEGTLFGLMCL